VGGPRAAWHLQHGQHACRGHALLLQLRSWLWLSGLPGGAP
jgi:hypothetical protein